MTTTNRNGRDTAADSRGHPGSSDEAFDKHVEQRRGASIASDEEAKPSSTGSMATGGAGEDREHRVREEAYRRFDSRGGQPGDPVADWLEAEAEVDRLAQIAADGATR